MAGLDRLSSDDAAILRLESAAITGHTCKVIVVGGPGAAPELSLEGLRARVAAGLDRAPRARDRVAFTPLGVATPVWVDDPDFDLRNHVVAAEAGEGAGLETIVAALMSQRLDHTRPLWRMDLAGPFEDGSSAVIWRIHHAMADGMVSMRLGEALLWGPTEAALPRGGTNRTAPPPGGARLLAAGLVDRGAGLAKGASRAAGTLVRPREVAGGVRRLAQLPSALRRELRPLSALSSLDQHLTAAREVAFAARPLDQLKQIERAAREHTGHQVTVNDVLLGAVAGGIRHWLAEEELPFSPMRVKVPVSMHAPGEGERVANRDSFLFVDLPCEEPDPLLRLARICGETEGMKEHHDAEALYSFFHGLSHLGPLGRAGARLASSPHEFSLAVSNVPGPKHELTVAGAPLRQLYSMAEPADRHALRVSAVSYDGIVRVALCTDPTVLSGLQVLAEGIDLAVEEMVAAS